MVEHVLTILERLPLWVQVVSVLAFVLLVIVGTPVAGYLNERMRARAEAHKLHAEAEQTELQIHIDAAEQYREWFREAADQVDALKRHNEEIAALNREMQRELEKLRAENRQMQELVREAQQNNADLQDMNSRARAAFAACLEKLRELDVPTREIHDFIEGS